jgi:hypothetical protein
MLKKGDGLMPKPTIEEKQITRLAEHMVTMEFGGRGTWGGNLTDAIYLIGSMKPENRERFLNLFIASFEAKLRTMFEEDDMSVKNAQKHFKRFNDFNPTFVGGFHLEDDR